MKAIILSICAVLFLAISTNSYAIDRDAKFIDSIGVYGMSYKNGNMRGFELWGETALGRENKNWALVVGGGIGTDSPSNSENADFWNGLGGIKYYFNELTSVSLIGSYLATDSSAHLKISSASLQAKHRFIEASEGISPFLTGGVAYRSIDTGRRGKDSEIVGNIGLGCEFMLNKDLSFVIEGSYMHGESLNSNGYSLRDAFLAAAYITGYWD